MDVEPGDLILVKSRGWLFALGRRIGGNPYDHIGVVVDRGQTLNIDKPRSRLLPVERLLRESHRPLVLRPVWPSPAARDAFVAWLTQLAGREYDVRRTLRLIASLLVQRVAHRAWPLAPPTPDQPRWICTDAVLLGLERYAASPALAEPELDWTTLHCGTTNDFLRLAEAHPELLQRV